MESFLKKNNVHGLIKAMCCNVDAASRITQKEGPNKGRQFYTCGNDRKCNYFEWADQFTPQQNTSHNVSQPR